MFRALKAFIKGKKKKACHHVMRQVGQGSEIYRCQWCSREERHRNLNDIL